MPVIIDGTLGVNAAAVTTTSWNPTNLAISGNGSINGNTTIGDTSGDTLTVNAITRFESNVTHQLGQSILFATSLETRKPVIRGAYDSTDNRDRLYLSSPALSGDSVYSDITFSTGFYSSIAERMRIDSAGGVSIGYAGTAPVKLFVSNATAGAALGVGIGSTLDGYLQANSSSVLLASQGAKELQIKTNSTQDVWLGTNNTERMRIFANGAVTIGNSTAYAKLAVVGTASALSDNGILTVQDSSQNGLSFGFDTTNAYSWIYSRSTGSTYRPININNAISVIPGAGFTANEGRLGVGTSSPSARLHVSSTDLGDTGGLKLTAAGAGGNTYRIWPTQTVNGEGAGKLLISNDGGNRIALTSDGQFIVGTTGGVNSGRIHSYATSGYQAYTAQVAANQYSLFQGFNSGGTVAFQVTGDGTVLVSGAAGQGLQLYRDGVTGGGVVEGLNGTSGSLKLSTNATVRTKIDGNGKTYIGSWYNNVTYPTFNDNGSLNVYDQGTYEAASNTNPNGSSSTAGANGGWVYLGDDQGDLAHGYARTYHQLCKHHPGYAGSTTYEIMHRGDYNYSYGGHYLLKVNYWYSSTGDNRDNFFNSVSLRCLWGKKDGISVLVTKDNGNGIWLSPNTSWGYIAVRRVSWEGSRDLGASYCACENNGALNGSTINTVSPSGVVYTLQADGGYDIRNAVTFSG